MQLAADTRCSLPLTLLYVFFPPKTSKTDILEKIYHMELLPPHPIPHIHEDQEP